MQSIPLAVLKPANTLGNCVKKCKLHAIHTACGIETEFVLGNGIDLFHCMQSIPLAVLKKDRFVQNP